MSEFNSDILRKGRPTLSKDKLNSVGKTDDESEQSVSTNRFGGFRHSQELISKSGHSTSEDVAIAAVEQALCKKYHIKEPKEIPNTIGNGSSDDDTHLTPIGMCLDDRKNPKIWGLKQKDRTYHSWLLGPTGSGKMLENSTQILTMNGWVPIGQIEVGDVVCTRNGNYAAVSGVFHHQNKPVWELELKNGQVIECGDEHLWIVLRKNHGRYTEYVKTTEELYNEGVFNGNNTQGGAGVGYKNAIPLCAPIEMDVTNQPIDPYVLGALIGDGSILKKANLTFATRDQEMLDFIEERLPDYELLKKTEGDIDCGYRLVPRRVDETVWRRPNDWVSDELAKLGLLGCHSEEKFVPEIYKNCSIEQRYDLLRGLMDTDGTAYKGRLSYSTISTQLRDDVVYIARSLGLDTSVRVDNRKTKYLKTDGKAYTVQIFAPDDVCLKLFRLTRKLRTYQRYCDGRSETAVTVYQHNDAIKYSDAGKDPEMNPYLYGICLMSTTDAHSIKTGKLTEHAKNRLRAELNGIDFESVNSRSRDASIMNIVLINGTYWNGKRRNALLQMTKDARLQVSRKNKRISDEVMHSSVAYRTAVLQGILDIRGDITSRQVDICNQYELLDDIKQLAESLGYTCTKTTQGKKNPVIHLGIQLTNVDLFSDPEKRQRVEEIMERCSDGRRTEYKRSCAIVDIRKTNRRADMTCIAVDDPSESFIIENFTVTHNTTLLANMIECDMWQHRGGLLIEPAGDLSETILKSAPPYRIHDTVYLDLLDPLYAPGFNLLELPPTANADERQNAVGAVTTLMSNHFGLSGDMARLMKTLQSALNALAFVPGATVLEVMDFYRNEDIQKTVLSFMPEGAMKDEIVNRVTNIKVDELGSLENRISRFTNNRYLKHMFGQSHTTMNWLDLMNKGAMVICPIRKGGSADSFFVTFCGSYIVSEVYTASYQRYKIPEKDRIIFPVILDEFQNYVSGDIEHMLAECRKYGLAMVLSHQYISQVKKILDAIDNSCRTKLAYAPSATDAPVLAKSFPHITAEDLMSLPKYHIMAVVQQDGGTLDPFMSAVLPPITNTSPCAEDVSELIVELTHQRYMRPRTEIDKEIDERKEVLASGNKEAVVNFAKKCVRRQQ